MKKRKDRVLKPLLIRKVTMLWLSLLVGFAVLLYLYLSYNPAHLLSRYLQSDANAYIFAFLMAILPLAGVPISIFLVLVGMLFGMPAGFALTGVLMLFHLVMTYYLVHSFVRPLLIRVLGEFHLAIPRLPRQRRKRIGFVFMILPGLPYAVKNYLLALAEMPLKPYLIISWAAHFALSIPFIILGKGVIELDPVVLFPAVGLISLGLVLQYYLRRRYTNLEET